MNIRTLSVKHRCLSIAVAGALASASTAVQAYDIEPWVRGSVTSRDISHRPGNTEIDQDSWLAEARIGVRDTLPSHWSWFVDVRALAASDNTLLQDQEADIIRTDGSSDSYYLQLREAYIRYSGLTRYPEEYLQIGLQRLSDDDGLWWDADIESITWQGNTTQLDWLVAFGKEFDTYRTDAELFAINDDVLRLFASADWDWTAYHSVGISYMKQDQSTDLDATYFEDTSIGRNADLDWYGVKLMSNWRERQAPQSFAYKVEWISQQGSSTYVPSTGQLRNIDVSATALDAGLRYDTKQWSFGVTHTRGSGGITGNDSSNFSQSGLHTNRGRYFGGRQRLIRFNEALRADITNLTHSAIFVTWQPNVNWETVLLIGDYQKTDSQHDIYSLGRRIETVSGSSDIGMSTDLNVTYYPNEGHPFNLHLLRVRMGYFEPGDAMVNDSSDYRITLDAQFWF
ncbi:alginate export family protein [Alteromonas facilis]|uniref:alginate export family protein n=1 Tax=Alteromonas facilis TaxID=2048004 RepID=UPI000C28AA14|nr:alginate export family protein [Alteromonas facilis]